MGTMQQMPDETSKKARRSDEELLRIASQGQPIHEDQIQEDQIYEDQVRLPDNLESAPEMIPALFDFSHGVDEARRDRFAIHLDTLLPHRAYDIAGALRSAYDAFSVYHAVNATPVLQFEETAVPVSVQSLMKDLIAGRRTPEDRHFDSVAAIRQSLEDWVPLREGNRLVDFSSGLSLFRENLAKFILKRLEGIRLSDNTTLVLTPPDPRKGLYSVTVHCRTSGYRILSSPAYFVDWTYFGAPSFPVTNSLLPGRYIFGTDSLPGCVLPDGVIFRIPFDFNPQLMRF